MVIHFRGGAPGGSGDSFLYAPPPPDCKKCHSYREKMVGDSRKAIDDVTVCCLDCFLAGGVLERYGYSVSPLESAIAPTMTCTIFASDSPEQVIERAVSLLQNGFGKYNLLVNNCEDFAFFCKTGNKNPPRIMSNAASWVVALLLVLLSSLSPVPLIPLTGLRISSKSEEKQQQQ